MANCVDTYKDSGIEWIGKIPQGWSISRNKNVFSCGKDIVGSASTTTQLLSLTKKGVIKKDINNTEGKQPESFDTYQFVEINDMVMCLFDLDCSAVFSGISNFNGMISPAYKILKCKNIVPQYADFWFRYISDGRKFNHYAKNIRFTLNYEEFSALPILTPTKDEQQAIADYLDKKCGEIDKIVETETAVIEKLKEFKQSIITEAVTKGLDKSVTLKDSGIEWIGKIPAHWNIIRIKQLLKERIEKSDDGIGEPLSMSQKFGLIPTKCMDKIPNMASSLIGTKRTYVDDIVFNKLKAHLGVFSVSKFEGLVSPDYAVYFSTGRANLKYLEYLFKTQKCILEFKKYSTGIADGLTRLYTGDLFSIYCPYPSVSEQNEIADYLDKKCGKIDKAITDKEQLIEKFTEYKKSLIYECVTGKKEVA